MPQSLLPWVRRVVVGSTNPVKLAAVRAVIARVAPDAAVQGVAVASGVPDQPWGDEETRQGAAERARRALLHDAHADADLGVGVEGGVVQEPDGTVRTCAWAFVCTRDGRQGVGGSLAIVLPPEVADLVRAGTELGHAIDAVAKLVDSKRRSGAVGILTGGLIDRQRAYEPLITYALAPFLAADYYERVVPVPQGVTAVPPTAEGPSRRKRATQDGR
ncbi:MAG: inosine/xanthosine triphosphatase [Phycisphaerae bacterium]|nr:inosine/xanthosine triphosphatase [Gemmatimonadaceae bacterium]